MEGYQITEMNLQTGYIVLKKEQITSFLEELREKNYAEDTMKTYRRALEDLYAYLPKDKIILRGTLEKWREDMLGRKYAVRTINNRITIANSFLEYLDRREFQLQGPLHLEEDVQPELTRTEYLRLLSVAKQLGRERAYFLMKVLGSIGISLHDLPLLTVEALKAGRLVLPTEIIYISGCLQKELLGYTRRNGITTGAVFVTKNGKLMNRSNITVEIQRLCEDARVERRKVSPRCLRKLYQETQEGLQANLALLLQQAYDRLLEAEQMTVGWENRG